MTTPPPGWERRSIDEAKPAGCPPKGSIWYTDRVTGASTTTYFSEQEAIEAAWMVHERLERMLKAMQPYYDDKGITIYHGDCRKVLPMLTERPALVLTDPPYGAKEKTNRESKKRGWRHEGTNKFWPSKDHAPIVGDDKPFDPAPILELKCPSILWGANYYADKLPPSRCWFAWDKREGTTPDDNADCELAWTNFNAPARLYSHLWRGVCRASEVAGGSLHPSQKPVALMRWCLLRAKVPAGALVLDPYMGSGPVAQACKELGLRYIGIELVEQYCEIAAQRLSQEVLDLA